MLIHMLRQLERDGLISHREFRQEPSRVKYALTDLEWNYWRM
jgi:DNA-binding HxlR family transcriptional regulator